MGGRFRVASCVLLSTALVQPWNQGVEWHWSAGAGEGNVSDVAVEGCDATTQWMDIDK